MEYILVVWQIIKSAKLHTYIVPPICSLLPNTCNTMVLLQYFKEREGLRTAVGFTNLYKRGIHNLRWRKQFYIGQANQQE